MCKLLHISKRTLQQYRDDNVLPYVKIGGKILDDRGAPLPGASVKIVQSNQAVQSSVDGSYSFSLAPGSYTVEVSYLSFQTKRITQVEV